MKIKVCKICQFENGEHSLECPKYKEKEWKCTPPTEARCPYCGEYPHHKKCAFSGKKEAGDIDFNMEKEILEISKKLKEAGLEDLLNKIVYMPVMPMIGIEKSYVIEEWYGIKVAKIIRIDDD